MQFRAETPQNREELYCGALEMHFHCMVFTNSQSQIPNDSNSIIDLTKIVLRLLGVTLPHVCRIAFSKRMGFSGAMSGLLKLIGNKPENPKKLGQSLGQIYVYLFLRLY